jgi:hypothetical protein
MKIVKIKPISYVNVKNTNYYVWTDEGDRYIMQEYSILEYIDQETFFYLKKLGQEKEDSD